MKFQVVPVLSALLLAAAPCAAQAITATPVTQVGAPVQIESCSAQTADYSSAPEYGHFSTATERDSSGRITYAGPPAPADQHIPMMSMYAGTHVFGWAQSVNGSGKAVSGVVYQFNVMSQGKQVASFYGSRTGTFTQNARITPYYTGLYSPWKTDVAQPKIDTVSCFVAFVKFGDGTSWLSPMATIPQALQSSP